MAVPAYESDFTARVFREIRARVGAESYSTWFDGVQVLPPRAGRSEVVVPTWLHGSILRERFREAIADATAAASGEPVQEVEIRTASPRPGGVTGSNGAPPRATVPPASGIPGMPLRPEYTFERFVAGPANRFAHAAARAVAEHPGQQYNPLFLHGSVGLGKTHLLQAIARSYLDLGMEKVVAISCSQFTDDFIASIPGGVEEFRRRYRDAGALLIDDIHFLEAKHRTLEEFFHTFNTLTNLGRQIVLTSDSPPDEIAGLGERLISRFRRGLVAQLTPPDLETRVAIVMRKGKDLGTEISTEIAELVAQRVRENVRELEGAVLRLHGIVHLERRRLDLESARQVLSELFGDGNPRIDLAQVQQAVVDEYGVKPADLHSRRRTRSIVLPRQVAMYLARRFTTCSLGEIGQHFGGRDHTTVLHAVQKIEALRGDDVAFRRRLEATESRLLR